MIKIDACLVMLYYIGYLQESPSIWEYHTANVLMYAVATSLLRSNLVASYRNVWISIALTMMHINLAVHKSRKKPQTSMSENVWSVVFYKAGIRDYPFSLSMIWLHLHCGRRVHDFREILCSLSETLLGSQLKATGTCYQLTIRSLFLFF